MVPLVTLVTIDFELTETHRKCSLVSNRTSTFLRCTWQDEVFKRRIFPSLVADFPAFGLIWRIFLDFCSWPAWPQGNWPLTRPGSRNPSPSHSSDCSRSSPAEEQSKKKVGRKIKFMPDRLFSFLNRWSVLASIYFTYVLYLAILHLVYSWKKILNF